MENFDKYIRQGEPNQAEKAKVWRTAIGLQQVDGSKPSAYLIETARQNIEGDISIGEVKKLIESYDQQYPTQDLESRTEEADKVLGRSLFAYFGGTKSRSSCSFSRIGLIYTPTG